jgi:hypothetical protein
LVEQRAENNARIRFLSAEPHRYFVPTNAAMFL